MYCSETLFLETLAQDTTHYHKIWLDKLIYEHIGWYPELVFICVVFSNSTDLAAVILNSSVFKIFFLK